MILEAIYSIQYSIFNIPWNFNSQLSNNTSNYNILLTTKNLYILSLNFAKENKFHLKIITLDTHN